MNKKKKLHSKNKFLKIYLLIVPCFILRLYNNSFSQIDTSNDVYFKKNYIVTHDVGFSFSSLNIKTAKSKTYFLNVYKYYPSYFYNISFIITKLYVKNKTSINLKNCLLFSQNYVDLKDTLSIEYRLYEDRVTYLLLLGIREPVKYNYSEDKYFKAVDFYVGSYFTTPGYHYLERKDNLNKTKTLTNYAKVGLSFELIFSALNKEGYGHRFGIRIMNDSPSTILFKKQPAEIRPSFNTISFLYTLFVD